MRRSLRLAVLQSLQFDLFTPDDFCGQIRMLIYQSVNGDVTMGWRLNLVPGQVEVGGSLERVSWLVRLRINLRS